MTDTDVGSPGGGQVLTWNSSSSVWKPQIPTLDQLGDTNLSFYGSPSGGQVLTWNSSASAWISENPSVDLSSVDQNILPDSDNSRNLGSSTKKWTHIYAHNGTIGDLVMHNENGHFTLDEQEDFIRVYNHKNGKYYKLVMQEIE